MKLLIQGGRIIDGAQQIDRIANLVVADGRIAGITDEDVEADCTIDAKGLIVSPGFIDMHMHEDPFDEEQGRPKSDIARSMALMGVTTCMGGNCGENVYAPDLYLDALDRFGSCVNQGLFAGHTYVRCASGGTDKYAPVDADTLSRMQTLTTELLDAGCMGVSFGVKYIPGTTWEEIVRLASLCKADDRLVASHVRNDVGRVFDAVAEMAELARETGVRVQISHVGSMGGYGQMERLLRDVDRYRSQGIDMACDCYPYDAFSTTIGATTYDEGFLDEYQADYDSVQLVDGTYGGARCTKEIFDWAREHEPWAKTIGYFMKPEDIELALRHPHVLLASDGLRSGAKGHPRAAGSFPRLISAYVKTGKLPLAEALSKMTHRPAERLSLEKKGNFRIGSDADITIFDLDRIEDRATYDEPSLAPAGIAYVLIAGSTAVQDGELVDETLGKSVRFGE
ncbi:MAG TPA: amidohydrolase family protein [Clostridiales bacterium]|jgi:N-acyl-D-amino-acid deacylase|nr:amidohydrolase family protein [Clostridiales bacterium]